MRNFVEKDLTSLNSKSKKIWGSLVPVVSLVNCFFIPEWANFFGDLLSESYLFTPTPLFNAYFALPITVILVSLCFWFVICLSVYFQCKKTEAAIYLVLLFGLVFPLNFAREYFAVFNFYPSLSHGLHRFADPLMKYREFWGLAVVSLVGYWVLKKMNGRITPAIKLLGWVLSPILLVTLVNQLYAFTMGFRSIPANREMRAISQAEVAKRIKIVWLIFDELDYILVLI